MPINLGLNGNPKFDASLLPWLRQLSDRITSAFNRIPVETIGLSSPSSPYIGQTWFSTVDNTWYTYDGAAWKATVSLGLKTWTTTLTQGVGIAHTKSYANYARVGDYIHGEFLLVPTGAGTANNPIIVNYPVAPLTVAGQGIGSGYIYTGAQRVPIMPILFSGAIYFIDAARVSGAEVIGQNLSNYAIGLGVGTSISAEFRYQVV